MSEAQSLSVKRAEVEFHNFASLGQPERVMLHYAAQNVRRGGLIRKHLDFIGDMTPFLEIGANAGHTSYMLQNDFGASGFMLDISEDSLRYGIALQEAWNYPRSPVRVAGDALRLPFRDSSLRFVMTHQTLSQFADIGSVFREVKRILMPGGVFLFSEEPLLRSLSLRLYRAPYYDTMKLWERKLFDWGLLGFFVRDVIGAQQEESFGIRQNHTMGIGEWDALVREHFPEHRHEIYAPERGWVEKQIKDLANRLDPHRAGWTASKLLGGTLATFSKKEGVAPAHAAPKEAFENLLQCPDCGHALSRQADETLVCNGCAYRAALDAGVYNLLCSSDKSELYPGDRDDIADFTVPGHERRLIGKWNDLEGIHGAKYRWIGEKATVQLARVKSGPLRLRVRGFAVERNLPVQFSIRVNGAAVGNFTQDRPGIFVLEADVPDAPQYDIEINAGPSFSAPGDDRVLTVSLGMVRLVPRD